MSDKLHQFPIKLAIWASGTGSNAMQLHRYFHNHPHIRVALLVTNRHQAPVLRYAQQEQIPFWCLSADTLNDGPLLTEMLESFSIQAIALAGYLRVVPDAVSEAFTGKIFNIHPSLLPAFGGKGMYGMHVHRAVCASGEKESGITIHRVSGKYDEGEILFQKSIALPSPADPEEVARLVQTLEHQCYGPVIEQELMKSTAV